MKIASITFALGLAACANDVGIHHAYDDASKLNVTEISGTDDAAGGPRQKVILLTDSYGRIVREYHAAGPGTWQTFTEGGLSGAAIGAGSMIGLALQHPPVNVTQVSQGGAQIGSGAVSASAVGKGGNSSSNASTSSSSTSNAASSSRSSATAKQHQGQAQQFDPDGVGIPTP